MVDLPHGTVTFLFTDVEGSTQLLRQLGKQYAGALEEHLELLRAATVEHGGREIDTQGDAFFAAFTRATDAVEAAIEAQRALAAHAWPDGSRLFVRMGLHTGEPAAGRERFVGLGVHRAARICAAGHGGQVLVSDATHQVLHDDPPEDVSFKDLGRWRLKDFHESQHLYQVLAPGLRRDFPRVRTAGPTRRRGVGIAAAALGALAVGAVAIATFAGGGSQAAKAVVVKADAVGVIDPASNRLKDQIEVGPSPSDVLSTRGAVWVSNADGHSVSRIDPATDQVKQRIPVGSGPAGLTYAGGAVWVANSGEQTLSRIDPASGSEKRVNVGATPTDLLAADGSLWMSSQQSGTVSQLDPRTGQVENTITPGGSPSALVGAAGSVWAANPLDGTVTRIDADSGAVKTTIPVGNGPDALAAAPDGVWVSEQYGGTVARIDPRKNEIVRRIAVGNRPTGVALVNGALWVGVRASGSSHRGGTLTVVGTYPLDIDPAIADDPLSGSTLNMTNDGLVAYEHVGGAAGARLVPDLAVSLPHPTDGGRAYRFVLRRGIRYSTGASVRADDVRASFERLFKTPHGVSGLFTGLVGAAACLQHPGRCDLSAGITTDPSHATVTFHLTAPDPNFLNKLASSFVDLLPAGTPTRPRRTPVPLPATGPYEIAQYRFGHVVRLVRNPRFHAWSQAAQPDGYPDAVVIRSDLTPNAAVDAVERNRADDFAGYKDSPPPARLQELTVRYAGRTHIEPTTGLVLLFMNTRVPPFNDVRVRRALNYALDRRALVRALGGRAIGAPTCQILPPNFPGYVRYCPYAPPQLPTARRLVHESGTRGSTLTVVAPAADLAPVASYGASVLRRLGYRASAKVLNATTYFPTISDSRTKEQIGAAFWGPDYPAAADTLAQLLSCKAFVPRSPDNPNWAEFCDPRIDTLMQHASQAQLTDPEVANQRWALVDHRVVDAAPWVPLINPASVELVSERVGNYQFNPQYGSLLDQLWVR